MRKSAIIIGIKSYKLNLKEEAFLKDKQPLGVILFSRNIKNIKQVLSLTFAIKNILGKDTMVLIDQEGGRVSRLNKDIWDTFPESKIFGKIAKKNILKAQRLTYKNYKKIGNILKNIGINYNCAPVLDLRIRGASDVIGSRAFSRDPKVVSKLSYQACKGLLSEGILPIIKHIPGHGRAKKDSHLELPIIGSSKKALEEDIFPFIQLNKMPLAMIAHIKYKCLDSSNCATYSKKIIKFIKEEIGFNGILISDDLCMKALNGSYINRAKKAKEAGCDIILHCEPNLSNITKSCEGAGFVSKNLLIKIKKLKSFF